MSEDFETSDTPARRKGFSSPDLKKRHALALTYFKASASFFAEQRKREVEDLKFADHDDQWDPTVKTQRAGQQAVNGQPPTPPRPTLVVNQLRGPIQQIANTRRAARLALEFAPKGNGATDDIAEIFEDIARAMQHESRAAIARNWAADRSDKAGLGWYRIDAEFAEDTPNDPAAWNDQDIVYRRILNQACVYPDPHAQEPDFSDGRRWFVTEDMPWDLYKETWPDSDLAGYDSSELQAVGDSQWVFTSGNGTDGEALRTVRIAEYWEVVERERTLVKLTNGAAAYDDEIPDDQQIATGPDAVKVRKKVRTIHWSKINGVEFLEEPVEWDGKYVPLIPTIGQESNVNGERRWIGIVRPARDAQLSYNVMNSARMESIALATKAPYMGFMETIEPYLEWWKNSNVRNYFILPLKAAYDKAGNLLPFPKRNVEEPAIQAITIAAASAKDDVHMTTGVPPVALGQLDPHDRSGKAISALQGQAEVGSSGYMDNLITITLPYEGKVIRDLIPRKFDRPGRIVPAVGIDEKRRLVMLNAPYVEDETGRPVMVPGWQEGMDVPREIAGPNGQPMPVKFYDLSAGEYTVAATVGKSYATRRQEASDAIGNVMKVVPPEMAAAMAPAWLEEQDYPGAKKIAEIAKKSLPPQLQQAYDDDTAQDQVAKAEIQALQTQVQQLQQALETDAVKEAAETKRAADANQVKVEVATIQAQSAITQAEIKAGMADMQNQLKIMHAIIVANLGMREQGTQHAHEAEMASMAHQQGLEAGDVQHRQALDQQRQGGDLAMQQAAQQAALQPPAEGA